MGNNVSGEPVANFFSVKDFFQAKQKQMDWVVTAEINFEFNN
jgi:hypothetical protein